jgi:hypothetical protein
MNQVLGMFGLLDFTMLQPVLAQSAFWNLWVVYFSNFPIFLFHHVTARSWLARILKLTNHLFISFSIFLGHSEPWITETADTEPVDTGKCLYFVVHWIWLSP